LEGADAGEPCRLVVGSRLCCGTPVIQHSQPFRGESRAGFQHDSSVGAPVCGN
jgi:hypothetical protein